MSKQKAEPVRYGAEISTRIIEHLYGGGSLREFCEQPGVPHIATVMRWIHAHPEFKAAYHLALEARGCLYGEKVADIGKDVLERKIAPDVARVAMDCYKWAAGRMAPKVFGDRVALTGADGGPVQHQHSLDLTKATDEQLDALERAAAVLATIAGAAPQPRPDPGGEG